MIGWGRVDIIPFVGALSPEFSPPTNNLHKPAPSISAFICVPYGKASPISAVSKKNQITNYCGTGILPVIDIIFTRCLFVNFCNILHKLSKSSDKPVSTHRQINYEETRHTPKTRPGKCPSPRDRFKPIAIFRAVSPESYRDNLIPDNKTITY
ncbi:MAG: hypothetical protein RLZZ338_4133 [Cyanobacteriota bacterium]